MLLKFIYLSSPPIVAVNCDNQKAMGMKNGTKPSLKNDFRKKYMTKRKSYFKSINSQIVSS